MDPLLGDCSLPTLRRTRSSEKWTAYPPDVLPAFVAEMDFEVARPIREAVIGAVERSDLGYPRPAGLGAAVSGWFAQRFGWRPDPGRIAPAPDVMSGVAEVLRAVTPEGSGVVINPPVYPPFIFRLEQEHRRLVRVPLTEPAEGGRTEIDLDALEAAFSAGEAAAYLLCSPHNPVGRVWSRATLTSVAELCGRYGVILLVDEIHAPLTLPGADFTPALSLPAFTGGAAPRTFVFTSASKAWNIPGLKCAVVVASNDEDAAVLIGRWEALFPSQVGALATIAAFTECDDWLAAMLSQLDENRRALGDLLQKELPEVGYRQPEASFLTWLDFRRLGLDDDPAAICLERGRVALVGGPDFGQEGTGFARLNIGTSPELLAEAVRRMAQAVRTGR